MNEEFLFLRCGAEGAKLEGHEFDFLGDEPYGSALSAFFLNVTYNRLKLGCL